MECFFKRLEIIINTTNTTAITTAKNMEISNKLLIIKTITPTARIIRNTMVASNGARLKRLSCHKA